MLSKPAAGCGGIRDAWQSDSRLSPATEPCLTIQAGADTVQIRQGIENFSNRHIKNVVRKRSLANIFH